MPGIKIANDDRLTLKPAFFCTRCKDLLANPFQTYCGHLICETCVHTLMGCSNPKCPEDGKQLKKEELFPDNFIQRQLQELIFHCLDASCGWSGCYNDVLQGHTSTMCESVLAICKFESWRRDVERHKVVCELITREFELYSIENNHDETARNGTLVWKIEGYERKREDAINGRETVLYSPHFYSAQFGYKMCAKIYFNGNGLGEMSHLSLFIVVMRGDYDERQSWPIQKKITMMLMNQGDGDHVVDTFHADPKSSSFQRPESDMNVGAGYPLFMPIDCLKHRQHVKKDVMIIKIIVE